MSLWVTAAALLCSAPALADDDDTAARRPASAEETTRGDARARAMVEGLGGADAYRALRYVSFAFVPEKDGKALSRREHAWDPGKGHARVRWQQKDGADVTAFVRLQDKSGVVRVNGEAVSDEARRRKLLNEAYAAWVNDVYWLLSPYKVFDEGVKRADVDGRLRTSFETGVGLTPGDVYLYHFDKGRLAGWSFVLESGRKGSYRFEGEKKLAGVTFFSRKVAEDGLVIVLDDIEASASPRPDVFAPLAR